MLRACCLSTDGRHLAVSYRLMTNNEPIKQAARVFDLQSGKVCVDTQDALGWPSKPANDKVLQSLRSAHDRRLWRIEQNS